MRARLLHFCLLPLFLYPSLSLSLSLSLSPSPPPNPSNQKTQSKQNKQNVVLVGGSQISPTRGRKRFSSAASTCCAEISPNPKKHTKFKTETQKRSETEILTPKFRKWTSRKTSKFSFRTLKSAILTPKRPNFFFCHFCRFWATRIGRTPRGSCNRTLLRRVLRRFFKGSAFLEGFLEGTL